ncbi:MAG: hypothetical protein COA79_22310 [Planctomycetota bacterium]|nr:MAG: hypothetical protein COA79_22310 [Planctomycetota bacterium]
MISRKEYNKRLNTIKHKGKLYTGILAGTITLPFIAIAFFTPEELVAVQFLPIWIFTMISVYICTRISAATLITEAEIRCPLCDTSLVDTTEHDPTARLIKSNECPSCTHVVIADDTTNK